MTRYTLHVPEQYNDGAPIGPEVFAEVEWLVLNVADGYTLTHGIGAWRGADHTVYREPVRLYAIDGTSALAPELYSLAQRIGLALSQEAVYLTAQEITAEAVYPLRTPVTA